MSPIYKGLAPAVGLIFTACLHEKNQPYCQPRTQALSTTRLAGGKTLVQAGHVSPRFWEITTGTYGGVGKANVAFEFKTIQGV